MLPKGTLVCPNEYALRNEGNREMVQQHGWLWMVYEQDSSGVVVHSLATGAIYVWMHNEYTTGAN